MTPLLHVDRLRKAYGARTLFDLTDFTLDAGAAYVLTGMNGAGKSTLLRLLCGLDAPDEPARIVFDGARHALAPFPRALRAHVVYVHQDPILFSTSVAHNVGYGLALRGMRGAELERRVAAALDWAGIAALRERQPGHLSGGERQRVALARAHVLAPRLLLLDEPTANLDGAAREQVIGLIPTLMAAGRTVVIACHDRDLINLPGVRRMKLRDGQLVYKPQELS